MSDTIRVNALARRNSASRDSSLASSLASQCESLATSDGRVFYLNAISFSFMQFITDPSNRRMFFIAFVLCSVIQLSERDLIAFRSYQDEDSKELIIISCAAQQQVGTTFSQADANLGELICGGKREIEFNIKNSTEQAIVFEKIKTSCGCITASVDKKVVQPNEVMRLTSSVNVPIRSDKIVGRFEYSFVDSEENLTFRVSAKYSLGELLAFSSRDELLFLSPGEMGSTKVNIIRSDPISFDDLTLEEDKSLDGVLFELKDDGDSSWLEITVPASLVIDGPMYGIVSVIDKKRKRKDQLGVSVRLKEPFTITPKNPWLQRNDDGDFRTNLLLSIRLKEDRTDGIQDDRITRNESTVSKIPKPRVYCNEIPELIATIQEIRSGLFKISLSVSSDDFEQTINSRNDTDFSPKLILDVFGLPNGERRVEVPLEFQK